MKNFKQNYGIVFSSFFSSENSFYLHLAKRTNAV